ncbi:MULTISPECIES: hypothetical protein [unclassified Mesorhizobium]|uniref:hypothetical protein n=1 Tax=unclassified Mesorhizobium TaxID=325217 RepID=UPI001674E6EA|nr:MULTISPECIES: hypothetical protein [unclassified Mesorhizobium]
MTFDIRENVFLATGRFCRSAAAMVFLATGAALLTTGGCTSSHMDGAAPVAGLEGPKDTGSYPNLNIPPQVAAQQLTDEERNAKLAQLKADQQAQTAKGGGGAPAANPAALSSLAKTHGDETLKQIEAKCDAALDPTCK